MAENKKSFLMYCDFKHVFNELTDEEAGKLIKHLLAYVNDEDPKTDDRLLKIAFEPIKQSLKRDLKKYEHIREKKREAGLASAEKRKQKLTSVESVEQNQQVSTNSTVNDSVNVSVNVSDISINTGGEYENKIKEDMIVLEMMKIWNLKNPNYFEEKENDYAACLNIAYKIAKMKKWKEQSVLFENKESTLASWNTITDFIKTDSWLQGLSLKILCNQFQAIVQKMNKAKDIELSSKIQPQIQQTSQSHIPQYEGASLAAQMAKYARKNK